MTQLREVPVDEQRFVDWVRPSLLAMTRLADRLAPHCDADDVVGDAVERAWRTRTRFDAGRGDPTAWLLTITASVARDAARRSSRRVRLLRSSPPAPEAQHDVLADVDLDRAVRTLPHRQQLAITCFYFLDLPVIETAHVMGCSEGTVKSTLSDARRALRAQLGDDHAH